MLETKDLREISEFMTLEWWTIVFSSLGSPNTENILSITGITDFAEVDLSTSTIGYLEWSSNMISAYTPVTNGPQKSADILDQDVCGSFVI